MREAGKRAVIPVNAHLSSFLTTSRADDMVNAESSRMEDNKALEFSVYSKKNPLKHKPEEGITILHFNDVYNVDSTTQQEPIGGAARFLTAMRSFEPLNPIVLFSGDVFSPSMLSFFTQGEEMVPVLNEIGTKCAVFGNHDFGEELSTSYSGETDNPSPSPVLPRIYLQIAIIKLYPLPIRSRP